MYLVIVADVLVVISNPIATVVGVIAKEEPNVVCNSESVCELIADGSLLVDTAKYLQERYRHSGTNSLCLKGIRYHSKQRF